MSTASSSKPKCRYRLISHSVGNTPPPVGRTPSMEK
ncbi:Uncharacterised protein [Vibrio cholerae]|nr:Uncharacterised protein [Vibrio cholerae]